MNKTVANPRRARPTHRPDCTFLLVAGVPAAQAYIGPGPGFALLSSFLVVFTTIILAMLSLLIWPFRTL